MFSLNPLAFYMNEKSVFHKIVTFQRDLFHYHYFVSIRVGLVRKILAKHIVQLTMVVSIAIVVQQAIWIEPHSKLKWKRPNHWT